MTKFILNPPNTFTNTVTDKQLSAWLLTPIEQGTFSATCIDLSEVMLDRTQCERVLTALSTHYPLISLKINLPADRLSPKIVNQLNDLVKNPLLIELDLVSKPFHELAQSAPPIPARDETPARSSEREINLWQETQALITTLNTNATLCLLQNTGLNLSRRRMLTGSTALSTAPIAVTVVTTQIEELVNSLDKDLITYHRNSENAKLVEKKIQSIQSKMQLAHEMLDIIKQATDHSYPDCFLKLLELRTNFQPLLYIKALFDVNHDYQQNQSGTSTSTSTSTGTIDAAPCSVGFSSWWTPYGPTGKTQAQSFVDLFKNDLEAGSEFADIDMETLITRLEERFDNTKQGNWKPHSFKTRLFKAVLALFMADNPEIFTQDRPAIALTQRVPNQENAAYLVMWLRTIYASAAAPPPPSPSSQNASQ